MINDEVTMPRAPIVLFALMVAGCGGPLDNIDVQSATLGSVDWSGFSIVVGLTDAPATLTIVDTAGTVHNFNVELSGPSLGLLLDIGASDTSDPNNCLFQSDGSLTLPAGKALTGADIAGGYFGTKEGLHLGIGGESHDLTNGSGVKLSGGALNVGFGFFAGFEWLSIGVRQ